MKKLLVVVDYQVDFVNGVLGFEGAEKLESGIASAVENTLNEGGYVLFTKDTHEADYLNTREGEFLPVPHCEEGSEGWRLFGNLARYEGGKVPHTMVLNKQVFGAANIAKAAEELCGGTPDEIIICGLVTNLCVIANAILLHSSFIGAKITVLQNLVGSGNAKGAQSALDVMRGMGMKIV